MCFSVPNSIENAFENIGNGPERVKALAQESGTSYLPRVELESTFICAYCLQVNDILVDVTAGKVQDYVEDCQVCCRPNRLRILVDEEMTEATVSAEPE
jgi:hypothetical protein